VVEAEWGGGEWEEGRSKGGREGREGGREGRREGGKEGGRKGGREEGGGRNTKYESGSRPPLYGYMYYTPTCTSIAGDLVEISTSSILIIDSQSLSCKRNNFQ